MATTEARRPSMWARPSMTIVCKAGSIRVRGCLLLAYDLTAKVQAAHNTPSASLPVPTRSRWCWKRDRTLVLPRACMLLGQVWGRPWRNRVRRGPFFQCIRSAVACICFVMM